LLNIEDQDKISHFKQSKKIKSASRLSQQTNSRYSVKAKKVADIVQVGQRVHQNKRNLYTSLGQPLISEVFSL
jgi:3-deoxy-D-arabino-heptulosonate 7-phosphate (DAHP) synthase